MMGEDANETGQHVQTLVRMRSGGATSGISTVSAVQALHSSSVLFIPWHAVTAGLRAVVGVTAAVGGAVG